MQTENKRDIEKLTELLKKLGLIPPTGHGDTMLTFHNSELKKAEMRITYKVKENTLMSNST